MFNKKTTRIFIALFSIGITCWSIGSIVFDPQQRFFARYYTEENFKNLERLYNSSQYRQKEPTALIADDVVFRYTAGAYIRGVDPILVNSEHTPLGKYLLGLSFLFFQNDAPVIIFCAIVTLFAIWRIGVRVFGDGVIALVPVVLFATEELFRNQLRVTPLLDIIQLPCILLAMYSFMLERKKGRFLFTSLCLGLAAATKSIVPSFLLISVFLLFFFIRKQQAKVLQFLSWLPIGAAVLILSYTKTFLNGYSFWDFLGFQKWILLYQQSKLIFPFSFWKLMLFNQWQTWWGDFAIHQVEDWRFTWPFLAIVPFGLIVLHVKRRARNNADMFILFLWALVYEIFLSTGIVVTRFLLPLLPVLYILSVQFVLELIHTRTHRL